MTANNKNRDFFESLDAVQNVIANLGTSNDVRSHTNYREQYNHVGRAELEAMFLENWIVTKVVEVVPADMTREWRTIDASVDAKQVKEFIEFEEDMAVAAKFCEAQQWARLYGGCGIILGIDEMQGGSPELPLDINRLGADCLQHLTVIEAERLLHAGARVVTDPTSEHFDRPEFYRVVNSTQMIHRSRILFFEGLNTPHGIRKRQRLAYWGTSIVRNIMEALSNSDLVTSGVAALTSEASIDIVKYKGLTAFLSQPKGEEKIRARFALMKLLKRTNNIMLLDDEESYENHQQAFAGLADIMEKFLAIVSGASDIPVTRLVGTSAKGLNATGEGDLKNYYDNIRARQRREFSPNLRKLDRIMQRSLWGKEAEDWGFTWNSLFQLSEKELAEMENARSTRDVAYINAGVIDPVIAVKQLHEDGVYTTITDDYISKLEALQMELNDLAVVNPTGLNDEDDQDDQDDELLEI